MKKFFIIMTVFGVTHQFHGIGKSANQIQTRLILEFAQNHPEATADDVSICAKEVVAV